MIKSKNEIANTINNFYCKLREKLSIKVTTPNNRKLDLPKSDPKTIFINPTNELEIINIINNLKLKKGGLDKINAKTLKVTAELIADTLAFVLNQCIEMSIWPNMLKVAEVIPIYKAGKKKRYGKLQTYIFNIKYSKNFRKNYT